VDNLSFPIVAVILSSFIGIIYFSKKRINNYETKIYGTLIITNLVETVFAFLGLLIIKLIPNAWYIPLLVKIDYIMILLWAFCLFRYVLHLSENNKKYYQIPETITTFYNLICIILILILDVNIINENNIINTYGLSTNVLYTSCVIYILLIIGYVIKMTFYDKKSLKSRKLIPLYVLVISIAIMAAIKMCFPEIILQGFIFSFVNLIMYHTIENPDMIMIEKLNLAKESAEKANHAKTDFLSSMSHEIRTPLNAIVGFSDCIENAETLEEAKENAKDVISAASTLLEIVNGVLDISKIEAGRLEIVNSSYDSYKLFNDVAKLVKPRMDEKALDFQIEIAPDLPKKLYGDYANLKKVITNLLSNASKYTEKGYVKYTVNCVTNKNICRIMIAVEDSGRGIKKENIDKLFTKFQRLDEDKNTTIEGTGLGLAITKKILELMGGKIVVQSIYGSGSKFTVVVDQIVDIKEIDKNVVTNKKQESIDIDCSNMRFLIVDDNKLNLKVATKVITSKYPDIAIETVESGFDCLYKIQAGEKYNLILMDDMMPKMSGVETLQKLKEFDDFDIPVIALTANAIAGMREKYLEEGFNEYLAKPIDKNELVEVLSKVLSTETNKLSSLESTQRIDFGELPKEIFEIKDNITEDKLTQNIEENKNEKTKENITVEDLKKNSIDVDHGIELLGDIDMYNETMKDFLDAIDERVKKLTDFKSNKDMANYAIEVHALKSDSKYLGFTTLADIAYEQELKSKENNNIFIEDNFDNLITELNRILKLIKNYVEE